MTTRRVQVAVRGTETERGEEAGWSRVTLCGWLCIGRGMHTDTFFLVAGGWKGGRFNQASK